MVIATSLTTLRIIVSQSRGTRVLPVLQMLVKAFLGVEEGVPSVVMWDIGKMNVRTSSVRRTRGLVVGKGVITTLTGVGVRQARVIVGQSPVVVRWEATH